MSRISLIPCEMGALRKTTQVQFRDCAKINTIDYHYKINSQAVNFFYFFYRIAKTTEFHRNNSWNTLHVCIRIIYASRCYILANEPLFGTSMT